MVHPKCAIIFVLSICKFFQYCNSNIGLFFSPSSKAIVFNLLCCFIFGISSLLLFFIVFFFNITFPTIAIAIVALFLDFRGDSYMLIFTFRYRQKQERATHWYRYSWKSDNDSWQKLFRTLGAPITFSPTITCMFEL